MNVKYARYENVDATTEAGHTHQSNPPLGPAKQHTDFLPRRQPPRSYREIPVTRLQRPGKKGRHILSACVFFFFFFFFFFVFFFVFFLCRNHWSDFCVARSASAKKMAWNPRGTLAGSFTVATGSGFIVLASQTRSSAEHRHRRNHIAQPHWGEGAGETKWGSAQARWTRQSG